MPRPGTAADKDLREHLTELGVTFEVETADAADPARRERLDAVRRTPERDPARPSRAASEVGDAPAEAHEVAMGVPGRPAGGTKAPGWPGRSPSDRGPGDAVLYLQSDVTARAYVRGFDDHLRGRAGTTPPAGGSRWATSGR